MNTKQPTYSHYKVAFNEENKMKYFPTLLGQVGEFVRYHRSDLIVLRLWRGETGLLISDLVPATEQEINEYKTADLLLR
jgi:hypothetical protein